MFNFDWKWKYITQCNWVAVRLFVYCLLLQNESGNQLSKMRSLARIRLAFTSDSMYAK